MTNPVAGPAVAPLLLDFNLIDPIIDLNTGKCVFSVIWRNYVICLYGENMANLITRMVHMEIVWRLYGESLENDTFYGDFML